MNQNPLAAEMAANQRVLLVGPPGLGKTAQILDAARETGRAVEIIRLALSERVDLTGALVPDAAAGVTRQLPLAQIASIRCRAGAGEKVLLFLDDLGQAPTDVQSAAMALFDPCFWGNNMPLIWGATNRPGDKAGVSALCEPLRSRFHAAYSVATPEKPGGEPGDGVLGTWADTVAGWVSWAEAAGLPEVITSFHSMTGNGAGQSLYTWKPSSDPSARFADFRSWEAAARRWTAGLRSLSQISAAVGAAAAAPFLAFARLESELPTLAEIQIDPASARLPSSGAAQWLMIGMIVGGLKEPQTASPALVYIQRFPEPLRAYFARTAQRRGFTPTLSRSKEFAAFIRDHAELFGEIAAQQVV